ncbi:MAG: D-glycero-beta-D-manno-heptose 1-phosphate adenylyltransferase [Candidatus Omnitrophota bacterium]
MPGKIKTKKELKDIISSLNKQGKRIVFTNGCFDILHYGHIKYLQDAKGLADVLVLGLNSDSSVKKIKGPARPINKQLDRARVLSALSCVDYLTIFSEDTPLGLIRLIQPDVLVKGGDWQTEKIVGADFVKARGGKVLAIPYIKGYSTTKLINKIHSSRLF